MSDGSHHRPAKRLNLAILRAAVHIDALRLSPAAYLRCTWWWVMGKKLRARMHLAPLLARSPRAYRLWQIREDRLGDQREKIASNAPPIYALIGEGDGTDATLKSCTREGIKAIDFSNTGGLVDLDLEESSWVLPLESGDILARGAGALYRAAALNAHATTHVIYSDDDLLDHTGERTSPHLKPDWNSELFRHFDYLTGSALLRLSHLRDVSKHGSDWASSLTEQAVTSCEIEGGKPQHLSHILHHRRTRPSPRLPLAPAQPANPQTPLPKVSVIVPTRNRLDLLRVCLAGLAQTEYPSPVEVIVIDNGSDDRETLAYLASLDADFAKVHRDDGPFNYAALNNRAVELATGDLLCFLNNDIEIGACDWLTIMARQAVRDKVGAVGARLLYPNGLIQHAGVVTGIGGAAAHAHRMLRPDEEGYFHRHSLPQIVTAVTAACMVVRRDRFEAVGGFDADHFAVSFNDVDLCLRLGQRGWRSFYEPRATLIHHESVTRGLDRDSKGAARQAREVQALQERWHTGFDRAGAARESKDPFHHPGLSLLSEHFVLRL